METMVIFGEDEDEYLINTRIHFAHIYVTEQLIVDIIGWLEVEAAVVAMQN